MKLKLQKQMIISSVIFFVVIITGVFLLIYNFNEARNNDMLKLYVKNRIEENKTSLLNSIDREITLVKKMAESPLLITYFNNPDNDIYKEITLNELKSFRNTFKSKQIFWCNDLNKDFYYNMEYSYTIDTEDKNNYWYQMTLYETKDYNLNINYNDNLKAIFLWVNAPVFENEKPVGMVGTGINLSNFISSFFKNSSDELIFFNDKEEITGYKDIKAVSDKIKISEIYPEMKDVIKKYKDSNNPEVFNLNIKGSLKTGAIIKVEEIGWNIAVLSEVNRSAHLSDVTYIMSVIFIVLLVVFIIFNIIVRFRLIKRLHPIGKALNRLASGDLTISQTDFYPDELGELNSNLNNINTGLNTLVKGILNQVTVIDKLEDELAAIVKETDDAMKIIVDNTQKVGKDVNTQKNDAIKTTEVINNMSNKIEGLIESLEKQTENIGKSSSFIEKLINQIKTASDSNQDAKENVNSLISATSEGMSVLEEVKKAAINISEKSAELTDTNTIMSSIAAQTNLLSMNAAIEAAHAGDSGLGFSVVAEEIRKLADQSSLQSKTVEETIARINDDITKMLDATVKASSSFVKIDEEVDKVSISYNNNEEIMNDLSSNGNNVYSYLKIMKDNSDNVKKDYEEMGTSSREMMESVTSFFEGSENINNSIFVMDSHINDIKKSISTIYNYNGKNVEQVNKIKNEINRFKMTD